MTSPLAYCFLDFSDMPAPRRTGPRRRFEVCYKRRGPLSIGDSVVIRAWDKDDAFTRATEKGLVPTDSDITAVMEQ